MQILFKQTLTALIIGLFYTQQVCATASTELPDLGSSDLVTYDQQTETALGRAFSTELNTQYDLIKDPETLAYLRRIGRKITSQTGDPHHFTFYLLNNPEINAFAGPNGIIGIHSGLILACQTEDELASVMAHEIAHITQHHLSRSFEYQSSLNVSSIATLIAAILVGSQDVNAGIATYMGGMGLTVQKQLKNSRIHEHEADYIGIQYLQKAGYDPFAMGRFFGRLYKQSQLSEYTPPEILMTHPVTLTRLAQADDRARQFPPFTNQDKKTQLNLIKARLRFFNSHHEPLNPYQILKMDTDTFCYQTALQRLQKKTKIHTPAQCLKTAGRKHPKQRLYPLIMAQYQLQYAPKKALERFQYLLDIYPKDSSILYRYAQALNQTGQTHKATRLLKQAIPQHHSQNELYQLLASFYNQQKNYAKAYYAKALGEINIGNLKYATHLLKKSQDFIPNKKSQQYIKVEKQINSINQKMKNSSKNKL